MFRFAIRDVLWLTVVVALVVGWAADHWGSEAGQLRHRAAGMRWALESEGWLVEEEGWTVKIRKPDDKVNAYELTVSPPKSEDS